MRADDPGWQAAGTRTGSPTSIPCGRLSAHGAEPATAKKQHVILDHYFDEGERRWNMMGVDFTNFHRTLSTCHRVYRAAGFALEGLVEPTLQVENPALYPDLDDELRVPNFIIFVLGKPETA